MKPELLISIIMELITMRYYANSIFTPKRAEIVCDVCLVLGYAVLYFVNLNGIFYLNVVSFVVVNGIFLHSLYKTTLKKTVIHIFILTSMLAMSEILLSAYWAFGSKGVNIHIGGAVLSLNIVISRFIYAAEMLIIAIVDSQIGKFTKINGFIWLIMTPVVTVIYLIALNSVVRLFNNEQKLVFLIVSILFVLANVVVFWINDRIIMKNLEIQMLHETVHKNQLDYEGYKLMIEKYEEMKIVQHDLKKYCNAVEALLTKEQFSAISMVEALKEKTNESLVLSYTESMFLNILLSQKQKSCNENGISLHCYFENINFGFIKELDLVTIFSNLIDNAVESCIRADRKSIYLNAYTMNESFYVIKIKNNSDIRPETDNGYLVTNKNDKNNHGFGIKSITKAVKQYNGSMQWDFDEENHFFNAIIMFNIADLEKKIRRISIMDKIADNISFFR